MSTTGHCIGAGSARPGEPRRDEAGVCVPAKGNTTHSRHPACEVRRAAPPRRSYGTLSHPARSPNRPLRPPRRAALLPHMPRAPRSQAAQRSGGESRNGLNKQRLETKCAGSRRRGLLSVASGRCGRRTSRRPTPPPPAPGRPSDRRDVMTPVTRAALRHATPCAPALPPPPCDLLPAELPQKYAIILSASCPSCPQSLLGR